MYSTLIKEISISFFGALIAIFSAGFLWLVKSAYEKYKAELFALSKFETMFVLNLQFLRDNCDFIDEWLEFLEKGQSYSFHFGYYNINYEEIYKLHNLDLRNKVLYLNYKLERMNFDFDNFYKEHSKNISKIDSIENKEPRLNSSNEYNKIVSQHLKKIKNDRTILENELIDVIANICIVAKVKSFSFFGFLEILFRDIYPKITQKKIETAILNLKKEIKKNNLNKE